MPGGSLTDGAREKPLIRFSTEKWVEKRDMMLRLAKLRLWIRLWPRYLKLGWTLRSLAADRRSAIALVYLGATTLLRSLPPMRRPVHLTLYLGGSRCRVALKTRTELDVLEEIGLEDEYAPADEIPAETIVDLGASVGLASLRLAASHPQARVIAVEADPTLVPRLDANLAGLSATVVHAAVAASSGERQFFRSDIDSWGNSLDHTSWTQNPVTVRALSLADLLDSLRIDRVDLLKLDVEGAEWEMLDGITDPRVVAIIGEVHGREGRSPEEFVERLSGSMDVETISADHRQATFVARRR
jgi:FkbM family methyltransferase